MRLIRTIKILLPVAPDIVLPTIQAYTNAFNHVCETGWQDLDCRGASLHAKTYAYCRQTLPAQLAVSARNKSVGYMSTGRAEPVTQPIVQAT